MNITRHSRALFLTLPNGTLEARGHAEPAGLFGAQGQQPPLMGGGGFAFASFVTGPSTISLNEQIAAGDRIVSQRTRRGRVAPHPLSFAARWYQLGAR